MAPDIRRANPNARPKGEEFHPALRSKRKEDQIDPFTVDPTLRLDFAQMLLFVRGYAVREHPGDPECRGNGRAGLLQSLSLAKNSGRIQTAADEDADRCGRHSAQAPANGLFE